MSRIWIWAGSLLAIVPMSYFLLRVLADVLPYDRTGQYDALAALLPPWCLGTMFIAAIMILFTGLLLRKTIDNQGEGEKKKNKA